MIKWRFKCGNHSFEKLTNLSRLLEVLQVMINMSNNIEDEGKYAEMVENISRMFRKAKK